MVITCRKGKNQPGKVANPARGQLNKENIFVLSPFAPDNLVSRDGFGSAVPRQPALLHTQADGTHLKRAVIPTQLSNGACSRFFLSLKRSHNPTL